MRATEDGGRSCVQDTAVQTRPGEWSTTGSRCSSHSVERTDHKIRGKTREVGSNTKVLALDGLSMRHYESGFCEQAIDWVIQWRNYYTHGASFTHLFFSPSAGACSRANVCLIFPVFFSRFPWLVNREHWEKPKSRKASFSRDRIIRKTTGFYVLRVPETWRLKDYKILTFNSDIWKTVCVTSLSLFLLSVLAFVIGSNRRQRAVTSDSYFSDFLRFYMFSS